MRLAILSDFHVMGPSEIAKTEESYRDMGSNISPLRRTWRRSLYRVRRRFWNSHPEWRLQAFHRAIESIVDYQPDWVVANGDYGGDASGVGLSDASTFESVASVVGIIRNNFAERCRFIFGDHDLGKYNTLLREGGIRLGSLELGEQKLGIPSFWHEIDEDIHLIGMNSSLFTLDLFLPEALAEEIPELRRRRAEHIEHVSHAFDGLPDDARVLLFCHDPSALTALSQIPVVLQRLEQIEMTVIGHLHSPTLLHLTKWLPKKTGWRPKYPVARMIAHGLEGARSWHMFNPVVCPSTFGAGHHVSGGLLFIEKDEHGDLVSRRHRVRRKDIPTPGNTAKNISNDWKL